MSAMKPWQTGWWCPTCEVSNPDVPHAQCECWPNQPEWLPIFEPLPADKREEADEPEKDAVCEFIRKNGNARVSRTRGPNGDGGRVGRWGWYASGHRSNGRGLWSAYGRTKNGGFGARCGRSRRPLAISLADAVLWVACGRLP